MSQNQKNSKEESNQSLDTTSKANIFELAQQLGIDLNEAFSMLNNQIQKSITENLATIKNELKNELKREVKEELIAEAAERLKEYGINPETTTEKLTPNSPMWLALGQFLGGDPHKQAMEIFRIYRQGFTDMMRMFRMIGAGKREAWLKENSEGCIIEIDKKVKKSEKQ